MCILCTWPTHTPMVGGYFGLFLTQDQYGKTMFGKATMVSENQTKSRFIEPILDLIGSLMEKEGGSDMGSLSLPRPSPYGKSLFISHYLSRFIEPRWFELVK